MNEEIFAGKVCGPGISEKLIDPEHLRKIQSHPCFSKEAAIDLGAYICRWPPNAIFNAAANDIGGCCVDR